jgi:hypothetical protein
MKKSELLRALQTEIRRHNMDTFVVEPPSMAEGGKGTVSPGCSTCKKHLFTMNQFIAHLTEDVLPALLDRLAASNKHD